MAPGGAEGPRRTVALAIGVPEFARGRVFDAEALSAFRESLKPMAYPWLRVAELGRERGFEFRTADQVSDPADVLLVSYDFHAESERLLAHGARACLLTSLEPPIIAWRLYADLPRLSSRFPYVLLFEGARDRTSPHATFQPLHFPVVFQDPTPGSAWKDRRHLVMVNSNKAIVRSLTRWFDRPREVSLKRWLASLRYPPIRIDGYQVRLRAIQELAGEAGEKLDLFGEGWHRRHPAISGRQHAAAMRTYRGQVGDKLALLGGYRYALAIENTRYPGYISEKLFDCFAAGCVPVYWGAPDVERSVPREAFIDVTGFADLQTLGRHLDEISEREWLAHREAGAAFLRSHAARAFSADAFAHQLVATLGEAAS